MGIVQGTARLLIEEAMERSFHGSVLQLGRQDIKVSPSRLLAISGEAGFNGSKVTVGLSKDINRNEEAFVPSENFFRYLGFSEVLSLDYSDYEGAEIIFNMNSKELPEHLRDRFDAVVDGGTMEHVFDVVQFLKNASEMLRVGGRIIHISPVSNQINHGFYCFSPTFFIDYYKANNYLLQKCYLLRYPENNISVCNCLEERTYDLIGKIIDPQIFYVFVIATKTGKNTGEITLPQQNAYTMRWGGNTVQTVSRHSKFRSALKGLLKKTPPLYDIAVSLAGFRYRRSIIKSIRWRKV